MTESKSIKDTTFVATLKPRQWTERKKYFCRKLAPGDAAGIPLVVYGWADGDEFEYLTRASMKKEGLTPRKVDHAAAMNLARRENKIKWSSETFAFGGKNVKVLKRVAEGDAAVASVLPHFLKAAQEKLGAESMAVALPDSQTLWVCDAALVPVLAPLAEQQFQDADEAGKVAISPLLFSVENGKITAALSSVKSAKTKKSAAAKASSEGTAAQSEGDYAPGATPPKAAHHRAIAPAGISKAKTMRLPPTPGSTPPKASAKISGKLAKAPSGRLAGADGSKLAAPSKRKKLAK